MPQNPFPEQLDRSGIIDRQQVRLRQLLTEVVPHNRFWANRFNTAGLIASDIQNLEDLRKLPCVSKKDIVADQTAFPPYGSNLTYELPRYSRMHQTSGTTGLPVRWLDTPSSWNWFLDCWAQIYRLVGLKPEDRICFPFSFGPFLGFWAAFDGAAALGNLCLSAGGLNSAARLQMILDHRATFICCTPTYALRLAEVAAESGLDLANSSVRGLIVAGEPGGCLPTTREKLETTWGARVFDHWGMTEVGPMASESLGCPGSLYVLETECIAEIIDPQTEDPVPVGEIGELVITNLGRWGSPLIRYRTGDMVRADPTPSPDGYSLLRLNGGILGRSDDMLTIRGNNFYPSSLEEWLRQIPNIAEYRITVLDQKAMQHVRVEIEPALAAQSADGTVALQAQVVRMFKTRLNFQVEVVAAEPGSLPRFEMKGKRFHRVTS
ncbi:MAG: Phenylacetate--CoA ligase [Planctomycetaceae bacterium]|nr:Phenylacetate--CoA ligase [Planctomycetaceae bacterium]